VRPCGGKTLTILYTMARRSSAAKVIADVRANATDVAEDVCDSRACCGCGRLQLAEG
jgi:predicted RNA methylase